MIRTYPFPKNATAARAKHAGFVAAQIESLPLDQDWQVDIRPAKRDRSPPQNRYLHALLGEIARATGMTAEDAKDALVLKFCGVESEVSVGGVTMVRRASTAKMDTKQCAEFCDQLRAWAAQFLGLMLPLPEEFKDR